jgi:hypothetical protein
VTGELLYRELADVARLLPAVSARRLVGRDHAFQKAVVGMVGLALDSWEAAGVRLDPVQFEAVVDSLVVRCVADAELIRDLATRLEEAGRGDGAGTADRA